jgi:hypothetical protein
VSRAEGPPCQAGAGEEPQARFVRTSSTDAQGRPCGPATTRRSTRNRPILKRRSTSGAAAALLSSHRPGPSSPAKKQTSVNGQTCGWPHQDRMLGSDSAPGRVCPREKGHLVHKGEFTQQELPLDAQSILGQVLLVLVGLSVVLLLVIFLLIEAHYIFRVISRLFERGREPDFGKPDVATTSGASRWRDIVGSGGLSILVKRPKRSGTKAKPDSSPGPTSKDP